MGNPTALYENLIESLCRTVDIEQWSEIAASQHMRLGEQLIGLLPDYESNPPQLRIFVELGQTHLDSDGPLYAAMLQANLAMPCGMPGHFALHPETGQGVYMLSLGLHEMDGDELAAFLDLQIDYCRTAMENLAKPVQ